MGLGFQAAIQPLRRSAARSRNPNSANSVFPHVKASEWNAIEAGTRGPTERQLLEQLVSDRIIVFLGYSGRDFDICPELATIKPIRGSVWLKWRWVENELRGLNANQARVLNNHSGTVVLGDLHSFLGRICSRSVENHGRQSQPVNLRDHFDFSLLPEWRVRVLDRLACPSLGISAVRSLQPANPHRRSSLASMLGHAGKYHQAARVVESQIADATTSSDKLSCLTDAAISWYVYGAVLKSRRYFRRQEISAHHQAFGLSGRLPRTNGTHVLDAKGAVLERHTKPSLSLLDSRARCATFSLRRRNIGANQPG